VRETAMRQSKGRERERTSRVSAGKDNEGEWERRIDRERDTEREKD
tara:strand:- start:353 stop:490 length:138 start_codon:yes stop_codon:yes gene_type:complete